MKLNHNKVEFICGTTVDRAGNLLADSVRQAAIFHSRRDLLNTFGGFSQSHIVGAWRNPKTGQVAEDVSIVFTCIVPLGVSEETLGAIRTRMAEAFCQASVPLVVTPVFASF